MDHLSVWQPGYRLTYHFASFLRLYKSKYSHDKWLGLKYQVKKFQKVTPYHCIHMVHNFICRPHVRSRAKVKGSLKT